MTQKHSKEFKDEKEDWNRAWFSRLFMTWLLIFMKMDWAYALIPGAREWVSG